MYMYIRKTKLKETETANFRLFAANGDGKRKSIFLGQQTINGHRLLLFQ